MQIYENRGFDVRERSIAEKLEVLVFTLSYGKIPFDRIKIKDKQAVLYRDFMGELVVAVED